ncbi:MAG: amidohydrolase family protein, partial [Terracidiphilus sp.]
MRRRDLLRFATLGAGAAALGRILPALGERAPIPVIDAHIHLFDPGRPGGVPWPEKDDSVLYKPALPSRYLALAAPFGIVGAVAVEASPLAADNQWLLDLAARNSLIVGVVGNLVPGAPEYRGELERLRANPLFLGFRYGNLWGRDLAADLAKPGFVDGLKDLSA